MSLPTPHHRPASRRTAGTRALTAAILLSSVIAAAGEPPLRFHHITPEDGLPSRNIYAIHQDQLGFLWLGTADGLVRWDGYSFTSYSQRADDPTSLHGRLVVAILEDHDGVLWVGTRSGGLNRFHRASDTFTHFRHDPEDSGSISMDAVEAIYQSRDGTLWLGCGEKESYATSGALNRFDPGTNRFVRYEHDPHDDTSLSQAPVSAIIEDGQDRLWVGTFGAGLDRLDRETSRFTHHRHDPSDNSSLSDDTVVAITEDRSGRLWIATWSGGINRLDPDRPGFRHYRRAQGLSTDRMISLSVDHAGTLWAGGGNGVLHHWDAKSDRFVQHRHSPADPGSLAASIAIWALHEDRARSLWVACRGAGLDRLDRYGPRFEIRRHVAGDPTSLGGNYVNAVLEDRSGKLWVGTRGHGIDRIDATTGKIDRYRVDPNRHDALRGSVITLHEGPTGTIWAGTFGGLARYEASTDRFVSVLHDPDDPDSAFGLGAPRVTGVQEDETGTLWIALLGGGLDRMDVASGRVTHYRHRPEDSTSLPSNVVITLLRDRYGVIWIGTENAGLCRFDPEQASFESFHSPETGLEVVDALHEDHAGRLWVGTFNGGLHLFDRATGTARVLNQSNGLPHNAVFSIVEDVDGRLWLGSGVGITRYDPATGDITSYGPGDGVRGDLQFGGASRGPSGRLHFGSSEGLYSFVPENLTDNPHPPQVVLTDLKINTRSTPIAPGGHHISVTDEITLAHDQNMVSIGFAGLHFSRPGANQYAYRLVPLEGGWNQVGSQRWATYSHLAPGTYEFTVKASNCDGVWNDQGRTLLIRIRPPFWRTWWAYSLAGLCLLAAAIWAERLHRSRLMRRERSRSERLEVQLRAAAAELEARALRAENERQTQELEDARQLQLSMLPTELPQHSNVDLAATMQPATEVGGDFYDFDLAADGTLTIAIGDATGHGSKAGTMVTIAKSLFSLLRSEADVAEVLRRSTVAIKRMSLSNLHMAMMIVRLRGSELEVTNAGMPPALIVRSATGSIEEVELGSVPLGSLVDFPYTTKTVELGAGDIVLLMSDGLAETRNPHGTMLGYEQVKSALGAAADYPCEAIIRHLSDLGAEWAAGGAQTDDLTLLALKISQS